MNRAPVFFPLVLLPQKDVGLHKRFSLQRKNGKYVLPGDLHERLRAELAASEVPKLAERTDAICERLAMCVEVVNDCSGWPEDVKPLQIALFRTPRIAGHARDGDDGHVLALNLDILADDGPGKASLDDNERRILLEMAIRHEAIHVDPKLDEEAVLGQQRRWLTDLDAMDLSRLRSALGKLEQPVAGRQPLLAFVDACTRPPVVEHNIAFTLSAAVRTDTLKCSFSDDWGDALRFGRYCWAKLGPARAGLQPIRKPGDFVSQLWTVPAALFAAVLLLAHALLFFRREARQRAKAAEPIGLYLNDLEQRELHHGVEVARVTVLTLGIVFGLAWSFGPFLFKNLPSPAVAWMTHIPWQREQALTALASTGLIDDLPALDTLDGNLQSVVADHLVARARNSRLDEGTRQEIGEYLRKGLQIEGIRSTVLREAHHYLTEGWQTDLTQEVATLWKTDKTDKTDKSHQDFLALAEGLAEEPLPEKRDLAFEIAVPLACRAAAPLDTRAFTLLMEGLVSHSNRSAFAKKALRPETSKPPKTEKKVAEGILQVIRSGAHPQASADLAPTVFVLLDQKDYQHAALAALDHLPPAVWQEELEKRLDMEGWIGGDNGREIVLDLAASLHESSRVDQRRLAARLAARMMPTESHVLAERALNLVEESLNDEQTRQDTLGVIKACCMKKTSAGLVKILSRFDDAEIRAVLAEILDNKPTPKLYQVIYETAEELIDTGRSTPRRTGLSTLAEIVRDTPDGSETRYEALKELARQLEGPKPEPAIRALQSVFQDDGFTSRRWTQDEMGVLGRILAHPRSPHQPKTLLELIQNTEDNEHLAPLTAAVTAALEGPSPLTGLELAREYLMKESWPKRNLVVAEAWADAIIPLAEKSGSAGEISHTLIQELAPEVMGARLLEELIENSGSHREQLGKALLKNVEDAEYAHRKEIIEKALSTIDKNTHGNATAFLIQEFLPRLWHDADIDLREHILRSLLVVLSENNDEQLRGDVLRLLGDFLESRLVKNNPSLEQEILKTLENLARNSSGRSRWTSMEIILRANKDDLSLDLLRELVSKPDQVQEYYEMNILGKNADRLRWLLPGDRAWVLDDLMDAGLKVEIGTLAPVLLTETREDLAPRLAEKVEACRGALPYWLTSSQSAARGLAREILATWATDPEREFPSASGDDAFIVGLLSAEPPIEPLAETDRALANLEEDLRSALAQIEDRTAQQSIDRVRKLAQQIASVHNGTADSLADAGLAPGDSGCVSVSEEPATRSRYTPELAAAIATRTLFTRTYDFKTRMALFDEALPLLGCRITSTNDRKLLLASMIASLKWSVPVNERTTAAKYIAKLMDLASNTTDEGETSLLVDGISSIGLNQPEAASLVTWQAPENYRGYLQMKTSALRLTLNSLLETAALGGQGYQNFLLWAQRYLHGWSWADESVALDLLEYLQYHMDLPGRSKAPAALATKLFPSLIRIAKTSPYFDFWLAGTIANAYKEGPSSWDTTWDNLYGVYSTRLPTTRHLLVNLFRHAVTVKHFSPSVDPGISPDSIAALLINKIGLVERELATSEAQSMNEVRPVMYPLVATEYRLFSGSPDEVAISLLGPTLLYSEGRPIRQALEEVASRRGDYRSARAQEVLEDSKTTAEILANAREPGETGGEACVRFLEGPDTGRPSDPLLWYQFRQAVRDRLPPSCKTLPEVLPPCGSEDEDRQIAWNCVAAATSPKADACLRRLIAASGRCARKLDTEVPQEDVDNFLQVMDADRESFSSSEARRDLSNLRHLLWSSQDPAQDGETPRFH